MPSMFALTVPPLKRGFEILSRYLDLVEAFAASRGEDPQTLLGARLAPDMLTLAGQVRSASDNAKNGTGRLTGVQVPRFVDDENTVAELRGRIARTVAVLSQFGPADFEGAAQRKVELDFRSVSGIMDGETYLISYLLPNFYFHVATAHGILRNLGVGLGKSDYFGTST